MKTITKCVIITALFAYKVVLLPKAYNSTSCLTFIRPTRRFISFFFSRLVILQTSVSTRAIAKQLNKLEIKVRPSMDAFNLKSILFKNF